MLNVQKLIVTTFEYPIQVALVIHAFVTSFFSYPWIYFIVMRSIGFLSAAVAEAAPHAHQVMWVVSQTSTILNSVMLFPNIPSYSVVIQ